MWKLTKKDWRNFHSAYTYLVLLFLLSIFMHLINSPSMNNLIFRGGYSLLFLVISYPILLIVFYIQFIYYNFLLMRFRKNNVLLILVLSLFTCVYLFVKIAHGSSFDQEDITSTSVFCSIILFIGYLNSVE